MRMFDAKFICFDMVHEAPPEPVVQVNALTLLRSPPTFVWPDSATGDRLFDFLHEDLMAKFKSQGARGWSSKSGGQNNLFELRALIFWTSGVAHRMAHLGFKLPVLMQDQTLWQNRDAFITFTAYDTTGSYDAKANSKGEAGHKRQRVLTQVTPLSCFNAQFARCRTASWKRSHMWLVPLFYRGSIAQIGCS